MRPTIASSFAAAALAAAAIATPAAATPSPSATASANLSAFALAAQGCDQALQARYKVTFQADWSRQNHPTDFPNNPHFSGLIGGTHQTGFHFWEIGALASNGMESMSETGSKSLLTQEVNAAISAGDAEFLLSGSGTNSPGSVSMNFDISSDFAAVTLVSMIAPSPDWFVGVDGLELFQNGRWLDQVVVDLAAYDSGTDSGTTYTSSNSNTNPADPIFEINGYPFHNVSLGTFTFEKLEADDLALCVDPLVAGSNANFDLSYGTAGEIVAIMWSTSLGSTVANNGGWCVDFGIDFPLANPQAQLAAMGQFDGSGNYHVNLRVPAAAAGLTLYLQAAEKNSCPDSRMSNIVTRTVM
jgi:hypothetical protein